MRRQQCCSRISGVINSSQAPGRIILKHREGCLVHCFRRQPSNEDKEVGENELPDSEIIYIFSATTARCDSHHTVVRSSTTTSFRAALQYKRVYRTCTSFIRARGVLSAGWRADTNSAVWGPRQCNVACCTTVLESLPPSFSTFVVLPYYCNKD